VPRRLDAHRRLSSASRRAGRWLRRTACALRYHHARLFGGRRGFLRARWAIGRSGSVGERSRGSTWGGAARRPGGGAAARLGLPLGIRGLAKWALMRLRCRPGLHREWGRSQVLSRLRRRIPCGLGHGPRCGGGAGCPRIRGCCVRRTARLTGGRRRRGVGPRAGRGRCRTLAALPALSAASGRCGRRGRPFVAGRVARGRLSGPSRPFGRRFPARRGRLDDRTVADRSLYDLAPSGRHVPRSRRACTRGHGGRLRAPLAGSVGRTRLGHGSLLRNGATLGSHDAGGRPGRARGAGGGVGRVEVRAVGHRQQRPERGRGERRARRVHDTGRRMAAPSQRESHQVPGHGSAGASATSSR
jgi:hypothetical protein